MDPLTALGLAANIAQFIEHDIKLTSSVSEIYHSPNGTTKDNAGLEVIAVDIQAVTESMLDASTKCQGSLRLLAQSCYHIGFELERIFEDLKIPEGTNHPRWQAFRQAIRAQGKTNEIEKLFNKLEKNRGQLATHMIFILSNKQSETLGILNLVAKDSRDLKTGQDRTAIGLESLKGDVLELARIIKNGKKPMGDEVLSMKSKLLDLIDQSNKTQKKNRILRSLEFEQMRRRKTQIQHSFPRTFDWVHHDPEEDDQDVREIKARFREWLSGKDGVFWVAGKPGSGKSTFMKFLGESGKENTERALEEWGGSARVLTAYYFFWIDGMPLQRSREGMLRSLLFGILRQAPGLIPAALPSQWDADDLDYHPSEEPWDLGELTQAFKNIVSQKEEPVKLCLFVDGLDEFDARNPSVGLKDLLSLTRDLGGFSGMKLCMSSRMWQEFEDHFHHNPWKLYLHDLTKKDVEWLIRERMSENERFRRLREEDPLGCEELFAGIASRAKGVILWVVLVVRQLLTEVDKAGEIDDLRKELQRIPPELKDYFRLMLERIEHKSEAARVLRVTSEAVEPLSRLAFHFLEKEWDNHDFIDQLEGFSINDAELMRIHDRVPKRLDKYAKDLLQVQSVDVEGDSFLSHRVEFLHRTVVDFLRSEEVAEEIEKLSTEKLSSKDEPDFEPAVSLCKISCSGKIDRATQRPRGGVRR